MKVKADPRHNSRRLALSSIFCWLFNDTEAEACALISKEHLEESDIDETLVKHIVDGVKTNLDEIDRIIGESAPEWPLDKISKVDLVILRIAIFEILFGKRAPVRVAIDEAIEVAKEYGNDTSHKFVNGVLGTVVEKYGDK